MNPFIRTPREAAAKTRRTLLAACCAWACAGAPALAQIPGAQIPGAQAETARPAIVVAQQMAQRQPQGNPRISEVAGRYAVLREDSKDTLCMVTLFETGRGKGYYRAQLAPACRDNGVVIFDPVAWAIDRQGRLSLQARKGHKMLLERDADGVWRRTEQKARPLSLRRI